jgi:hypothetical protein
LQRLADERIIGFAEPSLRSGTGFGPAFFSFYNQLLSGGILKLLK